MLLTMEDDYEKNFFPSKCHAAWPMHIIAGYYILDIPRLIFKFLHSTRLSLNRTILAISI